MISVCCDSLHLNTSFILDRLQHRSAIKKGIFALHKRQKLFGEVLREIYGFGDRMNNTDKDRLGLILFLNDTNYFQSIHTLHVQQTNHCEWTGIKCVQGRVDVLRLENLNFTGTIKMNPMISNIQFNWVIIKFKFK